MKIKRLLLVILLLTVASRQLHAQDFWQQLTPIEGDYKVQHLATNSQGHIFVGVRGDRPSYPPSGVFCSVDEGQSWKQVLEKNSTPHSLVVDENDNIYAGFYRSPTLKRSKDNGATWEDIPIPENLGVTTLYCHTEDTLYVGSVSNNGALFYRSYDAGMTWDSAYVHPHGGFSSEHITSMVITSDGVLYMGILGPTSLYWGGLYRSYDQGATWERIIPEVEYVEKLAVNSKDDVFIASQSVGFCVLRAGATTVETFPDVIYIPYDVVVDHVGHVYVKSYGGVHVSYDDGITFTQIQNRGITRLHAGKDNYLYGYHTDFNYIHRSIKPILSVDEHAQTSSNCNLYPNPARDNLTIYSTEIKENVTVSVYNLLGKKILETTINTEQQTINVSTLQSGVYLLKAQTSNQTYTSKFIKH